MGELRDPDPDGNHTPQQPSERTPEEVMYANFDHPEDIETCLVFVAALRASGHLTGPLQQVGWIAELSGELWEGIAHPKPTDRSRPVRCLTR